MTTSLIELAEGILVEAEVAGGAQNIAANDAKYVEKSMDQIVPLLKKVCRPITSVWSELNRDLMLNEVEIQLGMSFEGSGNLFIAKTSAKTNLSVKLKLKATEAERNY